jgi:hypothetical protein
MKIQFSALLIFLSLFTFGQPVPRFQKADISTSNCAAYFPNSVPSFEISYSEDSSRVYTGEVKVDDFSFGIICVKFSSIMESGKEEKEELLVRYLDFLKSTLNIKEAAGYGKGHTLASCPAANGIIDFWTDVDGFKWQVKGWINESNLSVLYIYGKEDYPNYNIASIFLNGFRFPEK